MEKGIRPGRFAVLLLALAAVVLAACAANQLEKSRGDTFGKYENLIRWNQWDAAAQFLAPDYLKDHPITRLEMERLRLFKVTSYTVRSTSILDNGLTARQLVEIRLFNTHQAIERSIMDEQEWRYDPQRKVWLLYSGLPDPTRRY